MFIILFLALAAFDFLCTAGLVWLFCWLNKDEYEAYMACDRVFGFTTDEYLPTEEQIQNMVNETSIDKDTLWSMFEKLS